MLAQAMLPDELSNLGVPLIVQLNAAATPAAVQALLRNVTYRSATQVLGTLPRTVTAQVGDGDGGTSLPVSEVVNISFNDRTIAFNFDDSDANNLLALGDPITYIIRFTRDIDLATVSAADFDNSGTAAMVIDGISEPSAGTLSLQLRALSTGTLILRIPASATVVDVGGPGQVLVPAQDENVISIVQPLVLTSSTVTTNGGLVQPNSCNSFNVQVRNEALATATAITGFASSTTAAAPIAQTSSAFPNATSESVVGNSTAFQFSVSPTAVCGSIINAEVQLNYAGPTGPSVAPVSFIIGGLGTVLTEAFDGVTAPALPGGWTTSQTGATPPPAFATTTTGADTAPNVAFTNGVATVSSNSLVTPAVVFPAGAYNGRLSFRTAWNFENDVNGNYDGGVLEVSSDNGVTWFDVTNPVIGGSFIAGGYNGVIASGFGNPLAGRSGFVRTQASYQTVTVQFPSSLNGQTLRFRFRGGWDIEITTAGANWRIDGVTVQAGVACTAGSGICAANQPARLAFASQPSNAATNTAISPAVSVQVQDLLGNPTSSTATVNVAIANNPGAATLSGSTSAAAAAGVASFANLSLNQPGSGYTLSASSPGLTGATSAAFDVGASATAGFVVGAITIPATTPATNAATRVRFPQTFPATPVVIVQGDNQNTDPQALRIANVGPTGFDVLQVEPVGCAGCTGAGGAATVHWLAALPGVYRLPNEVPGIDAPGIDAPGSGVLVKVGSVSTSASQRATARGGFVGWAAPSWQSASFANVAGFNFSSPPILLTALQSWSPANEGSNLSTTPLALRGTSQVWLTPAVRNLTATGFDVALESSSSDDNAGTTPGISAPETVGYVAIESGVSARLRANAGSLIGLASGTTGTTGTCASQTYTYPAGTAVVAANLRGFGGLQTRNEDDGGWIRRCVLVGAGGTSVQVGHFVDEDADLKADRSHPTVETVGNAVFGGDFTTTPVSLASLQSIREGNQLRVQFDSATEAGHVGYRIWGRANDREAFRPLHDDLIVSAAGDGMRGQRYSRLVPAAGVDELRIEDVDVLGHSRFHPSVAVGERVGAPAIDQPLDWGAIRRANAAVVVAETRASGPAQVLAEVRTRGIQRVSQTDLVAFGLAGVEVGQLAVLRAGVPVPRHVSCTGRFTSGCTLEFLGEPRESLYGSTMPYVITVNSAAVVDVSGSALIAGAAARGIVTGTFESAPNRAYSFVSPVADPWYDQRLVATTAPVELQRSFALPARAPGPVQLSVRLWGGLDQPEGGPDHSVELRVNGQRVATRRFDGLVEAVIDVTLDEGILLPTNQVTLRLLADTGHPADVVKLEGFTVRYPRYTDLVEGELQVGEAMSVQPTELLADGFEARAASAGFALATTAPTTVWSQRDGEAWRRDQITGTSSLRAGVTALVAAHDARIVRPSLRAAPAPATALDPVDYLVITHPLFEAELAPLLALQQARGYRVRVLRTDAIYAARSHHQPDPAALREVVAAIGPRFLLLVGGDSYDYDDHLGLGSQSFLPTFYRPSSAFVRFAPTDLPFVDRDADGVPERAIGRLPVRTVDELRRVVDSILARDRAVSSTRYFATAGNSGPGEYFGVHSRSLLSYLRQGQNPSFALADEVGLPAARAGASAALSGAADWINYLGHSSPNRWAFQNLLDTSQLAGITRTGAPAVVAQWGCWNNYFVMPNQDTMSQALLLRPNALASAVIGATALAEDASHLALGLRFYDLVEDGRFDGSDMAAVGTLGEALMHAKADLLRRQPEHRASNDSITLFGDPAMPLPRP